MSNFKKLKIRVIHYKSKNIVYNDKQIILKQHLWNRVPHTSFKNRSKNAKNSVNRIKAKILRVLVILNAYNLKTTSLSEFKLYAIQFALLRLHIKRFVERKIVREKRNG